VSSRAPVGVTSGYSMSACAYNKRNISRFRLTAQEEDCLCTVYR
jgi:hypothetical protein